MVYFSGNLGKAMEFLCLLLTVESYLFVVANFNLSQFISYSFFKVTYLVNLHYSDIFMRYSKGKYWNVDTTLSITIFFKWVFFLRFHFQWVLFSIVSAKSLLESSSLAAQNPCCTMNFIQTSAEWHLICSQSTNF